MFDGQVGARELINSRIESVTVIISTTRRGRGSPFDYSQDSPHYSKSLSAISSGSTLSVSMICWLGSYAVRQLVQTDGPSAAKTASKDADIKKGSAHIDQSGHRLEASFVCNVLKTTCPVNEVGLLFVQFQDANFHHDLIWILPQESTQCARKIYPTWWFTATA